MGGLGGARGRAGGGGAGELFSVLRAQGAAAAPVGPAAAVAAAARGRAGAVAAVREAVVLPAPCAPRGGWGGAAERAGPAKEGAGGEGGGVTGTPPPFPRAPPPPPETQLTDSVGFNMALLYGAAALFGTNQLCNKIAVGGHSPASVNMLRFLAASATMLPAMRRGLAADADPDLRQRGLELGAWLLLGYSAQSVGVAHTTAGHAAFTTTFTVLTVPLVAGLRGRRIPASTWAAGAGAVLGVALLDWGGEGLAISSGDLLCIASAMIFGVHTVRMEEATTRFPEDSQELAALQIAVVALGSIIWEAPELLAVGRDGGLEGLANFASDLPWALSIYMGVATTALTLWMEARAMKVISAPMAALIYSSEPLWGAGLSFLCLGERWGPAGAAGAGLVLAASLGSQIAGQCAGGGGAGGAERAREPPPAPAWAPAADPPHAR